MSDSIRVETGPGWELRCGDCLDPETGLASLESVDHVITDPPYSEGLYQRFRSNATSPDAGTGKLGARPSAEKDWQRYREMADKRIGAIDAMLPDLCVEFRRIAARWIIAFHDQEIGHWWREGFGDYYIRSGAWVKTNPMPQVTGDRPAQGHEPCTIGHRKGKKRWNGGGRPAIWIYPFESGKHRPDHPCPKPLVLMEKLVADFTDPGDLICDPFAGSGTTGVACIRMGRRFLGWELDENFFDLAVKRLRATRQQLTVFDAAPPGKQEKMFK